MSENREKKSGTGGGGGGKAPPKDASTEAENQVKRGKVWGSEKSGIFLRGGRRRAQAKNTSEKCAVSRGRGSKKKREGKGAVPEPWEGGGGPPGPELGANRPKVSEGSQ